MDGNDGGDDGDGDNGTFGDLWQCIVVVIDYDHGADDDNCSDNDRYRFIQTNLAKKSSTCLSELNFKPNSFKTFLNSSFVTLPVLSRSIS